MNRRKFLLGGTAAIAVAPVAHIVPVLADPYADLAQQINEAYLVVERQIMYLNYGSPDTPVWYTGYDSIFKPVT